MKKHKFGTKARRGAHAVVFGVIASAILLILISLLASLILLLTSDPLSCIGAAALSALVLTGAVAAYLTVKFKGEAALIPTVISSLVFSAMIIVISLLCSGVSGIGASLMNAVCYLMPSLLICVLTTHKRREKKWHRH